MSKRYDIVAVVGEYTNQQGEVKKKYKNVGSVMQNDNGFFMLMDKTFNPAGLATPDKDSIILSMFEPKPRDAQTAAQAGVQNNAAQQQTADSAPPPAGGDDVFDNVPFKQIDGRYI